MNGTDWKIDTPATREGSDIVLHELIDDRGETKGFYRSHQEATEHMQVGWTVRPAGEFIHQRSAHGPVKVEAE